MDTLPCPILFAPSERDSIVPVDVNGAIGRQRIPHAGFVVLPGRRSRADDRRRCDRPGSSSSRPPLMTTHGSVGTIAIRDAIADDGEAMSTSFRLASVSNDSDRPNL
jgi:hypothetical protein